MLLNPTVGWLTLFLLFEEYILSSDVTNLGFIGSFVLYRAMFTFHTAEYLCCSTYLQSVM